MAEGSGMPPSRGNSFWPALAIAAIIAATAGWTVVAVMVANGPSQAPVGAASQSSDDIDADPTDETPPPESHDFADLEALLPAQVDGAKLTIQSSTGSPYEDGDTVTTALQTLLTAAGKTDQDLQTAIGYDPDGVIDLTIGAYRVSGVTLDQVRDAFVNTMKSDDDTFKTATATVGGKSVTKGAYGDDPYTYYWYVADGVLFTLETEDANLAGRVLTVLSNKPPAAVPPAPSATPAPSGSGSASPSPSG